MRLLGAGRMRMCRVAGSANFKRLGSQRSGSVSEIRLSLKDQA